MTESIKVAICGACGRMGQETARAVAGADDLRLVGVCDVSQVGQSYAELTGIAGVDLQVRNDLGALLEETRPDVVVDFTSPTSVMGNVRIVLSRGIRAVVGTTGIGAEDLREIEELTKRNATAAVVAPNFAIGAVLMMKFAAEAARYMPMVEIIELHHERKLDAPSGTSLRTAEMIAEARGGQTASAKQSAETSGSISTARGFEHRGVPIHSVRLSGLVAHQEVIFGGQGQTLTIRHDSLDRTSFMPGVLLAIRKAPQLKGLVYGLEKLL